MNKRQNNVFVILLIASSFSQNWQQHSVCYRLNTVNEQKKSRKLLETCCCIVFVVFLSRYFDDLFRAVIHFMKSVVGRSQGSIFTFYTVSYFEFTQIWYLFMSFVTRIVTKVLVDKQWEKYKICWKMIQGPAHKGQLGIPQTRWIKTLHHYNLKPTLLQTSTIIITNSTSLPNLQPEYYAQRVYFCQLISDICSVVLGILFINYATVTQDVTICVANASVIAYLYHHL